MEDSDSEEEDDAGGRTRPGGQDDGDEDSDEEDDFFENLVMRIRSEGKHLEQEESQDQVERDRAAR